MLTQPTEPGTYDSEECDSVDLSDEEDTQGLSGSMLRQSTERAAVRIMRAYTRTLAKGDAIDRQISRVLKDLCEHNFAGRTIADFDKDS